MLYRNDEAKNDSLGYRNRFEQFGLFGQALWQVTESLELRGGLRWDHFSEFDEKITGSIEAIYSVSDSGLSLFAKLGSSYAPPSAADIAYDVDTTVTPLEPEESVSYEFGLRQVAFQESLTTSLVVFRNEIDELLDYDPGSFDTFNVEKAKTQGVEFQCDYALGQKTDIHFGYTHLHAVGSNGGLLRRPRHLVNCSIRHRPVENLSLGISSLGSLDRKRIRIQSLFSRGSGKDCALLPTWLPTGRSRINGRSSAARLKTSSMARTGGGLPCAGTVELSGCALSFLIVCRVLLSTKHRLYADTSTRSN